MPRWSQGSRDCKHLLVGDPPTSRFPTLGCMQTTEELVKMQISENWTQEVCAEPWKLRFQ